jgi:integrase
MIINLIFNRRHGRRCTRGRTVDSFTTEPEERKRDFKQCHCPIFVSGTLGGRFNRISTKRTTWDEARTIAQPYIDAGSWDLTPPPEPSPIPPTPPAPSGKLLISDAIKECLDIQKANQAAENTLKKYREVLLGKDGLAEFSEHNGLRYVEEWTPRLVRIMSNGWDVQLGTRRTKLSIIKPFFEQLVEDGIIDANPARIRLRLNRALRAALGGNVERLAFSDAELARMIEGCRKYGLELRQWPKKKDGRQVVAISEYREYARKYNGQDLADFIELSYSTGLRFMDIATFHASRMDEHGRIKWRALKNNRWVHLRVNAKLQKLIRDRARIHGPYIFGDPTGRKPHDVYCCWRNRLEDLWEQTGPWEQKPVHHRFRHTFVRLLFQNPRTTITTVARLLGDTEETVRRHYSNWIPEIQDATDAALEDAQTHIGQIRQG